MTLNAKPTGDRQPPQPPETDEPSQAAPAAGPVTPPSPPPVDTEPTAEAEAPPAEPTAPVSAWPADGTTMELCAAQYPIRDPYSGVRFQLQRPTPCKMSGWVRAQLEAKVLYEYKPAASKDAE